MPKYLLPCECGQGIAVDVSQAGQQLTCECGKLVDVPTLRGVRALEVVEDTASGSRKPAEWDASRGLIFAGSLILFFIGVAVTYYGYEGLRTTPDITREVEKQSFDKAIDDMSLDEIYETWKVIREQGLGERGQNVYVQIRGFRTGRKRLVGIGIGFCVIGLFGTVGATLVRRKKAT